VELYILEKFWQSNLIW